MTKVLNSLKAVLKGPRRQPITPTTAPAATRAGKKNFWRRNWIALVSMIVFVVIATADARLMDQIAARRSAPLKLHAVEVLDYKGEKLTSVATLPDNSIKGPQYVNLADYHLDIGGLVDRPASLTYEAVLNRQRYEKQVVLHCVEGWDANLLWEGVRLKDLLSEVGVKPEANTVIFYAYDGYSSSLPLDYLLGNDILLAYKVNGIVLPPERGFPFQLVAEQKWGYKWVKWITRIELSSDANYHGTWEKQGYSNQGDANGPKFDITFP